MSEPLDIFKNVKEWVKPESPKPTAAERARRANASMFADAVMNGAREGAKLVTAEEIEAADAAEAKAKRDASFEAALKAELDRAVGK